jgi:hypothetical protein
VTLLVADSTNDRIYVGDTTADNNGVLLVLDTDNDGTEVTGVAGAMYYNSSMTKFRCYTTSWVDCDTTGSGSSPWTDAGAWTYLTTTTDQLVIGDSAQYSNTELAVYKNSTSTSTAEYGTYSQIVAQPTSGSSAVYTGLYGLANVYGTAGTNYGIGVTGEVVYNNNSAQVLNYGIGLSGLVRDGGNTGTMQRAISIVADENSGTISENYGLVVTSRAVGSSSRANIWITPHVYDTAVAGNWSIYNSSTDDNLFRGNLRVGSTTAPTVALDVTGAGIFSGQTDLYDQNQNQL